MTLLDELLPRYHFHELHSVPITARPEAVWVALKEVTPREAPLLRALFALRGLPASARTPILDGMLSGGFQLLAEEAPTELVAGAVGQPWRVLRRLDRVDFRRFDEPGYAKMALDFRLDRGVLSTETRVLCTARDARRKFARYWRVVRPASGLTRRSWLAAIKRRAEADGS